MSEPRNPIAVARQIANVVPDEHQSIFEWLINDFSYKAPEQIGACFRRLAGVCNDLLAEGQFEHDWQLEMISILTTKSKEKLLAEQKAWEEKDNA